MLLLPSRRPARCPAGTYQERAAQGGCSACPAGYYCEQRGATAGGVNQTAACPVGHACPANSSLPTPCGSGTTQSRPVTQHPLVLPPHNTPSRNTPSQHPLAQHPLTHEQQHPLAGLDLCGLAAALN